jgi:hypothetical protein
MNSKARKVLKNWVLAHSRFHSVVIVLLSFTSLLILSSQEDDPGHIEGDYLGQTPPGIYPVLFAEGIIPEDLHSSPVFSIDGKSLYYKTLDGKGIMVMHRAGERWKPARPLFVNEETDNSDDPCISPSDNKLWFTYYSKNDNREYIRYCEKINSTSCHTGQPAGKLNTLDLHWQFSIANSKNIYFASNGSIYRSVYQDGKYLEPTKLGPEINSDYSECTPYVSPDERLLIFARSNSEKPDLFISRRNDDGSWATAKALGNNINTEHHEMCPLLSPDGKFLFFLSSRAGLFSAYWVDASVLNI